MTLEKLYLGTVASGGAYAAPPVRERLILVDALLRLRCFEEQIDELVGEQLASRQRLLVRPPDRRLAPRIENRASRLPLRIADHFRHLQPALHEDAEIVIDGVDPGAELGQGQARVGMQ